MNIIEPDKRFKPAVQVVFPILKKRRIDATNDAGLICVEADQDTDLVAPGLSFKPFCATEPTTSTALPHLTYAAVSTVTTTIALPAIIITEEAPIAT